MGFGGGQSQSSTTKTEPWDEQKPYLQQGFSEAQRIYESGPAPYYPGQTYTDMSDPTKAGLAMQTAKAGGGNPLIDSAVGGAQDIIGGDTGNPWADILDAGSAGMKDTASGKFLNNNPWLDQTYNTAAGKVTQNFNEDILPALNASLGGSGNAGSTTHELMLGKAGGELTDSLSQMASSIYGGDYANERDRMTNAQSGLTSAGAGLFGTDMSSKLSALGLAPGLRDAEFGDASKLREAGGAYEDQASKALEDDINRFNYNQGADMSSLQDFMSLISGNYGSTSTSRSKSGGSGMATGAGALLSILSML